MTKIQRLPGGRLSMVLFSVAGLALVGLLTGCQTPPPVSTRDRNFPKEGKSGPEARSAADRYFRAGFARAIGIRDVTADLTRQELVGNRLQESETLHWVQRVEPHSLHLTWIGERRKGREVVYVQGSNDDKVLVHEPGALSRIKPVLRFAPTSAAMSYGSRYSITVVGYQALVKRIVQNYDDAARRGSVNVVDFGTLQHEGYKTRAFKVVLDFPGTQTGDYHSMIVWFDVATGLPVHFVGVDSNDVLLEDYLWKSLKVNQDLTDADFTLSFAVEPPENPQPKTPEAIPSVPQPETKPPAPKPEAKPSETGAP